MIAALICVAAFSQDYKPLEPVEVGDYPTTRVRFDCHQYATGHPYYTASHSIHTRGISADTINDDYSIFLRVDQDIEQYTIAKINVGGRTYTMRVDFVANEQIYFNIQKEHIKHIAISGIQSIRYLDKRTYETIYTQEFNLIEQELWRRTADKLKTQLEEWKFF